MSYVRYTKVLVYGPGMKAAESLYYQGPDSSITVGNAGRSVHTIEELHAATPGSRIQHGFQIIGPRNQVLAERSGFPDRAAAHRGVRELRRALLPGVRQDVKQLAKVWQEAYDYGVEDARQAETVGIPEYGPNRSNPYQEELEEADRGE